MRILIAAAIFTLSFPAVASPLLTIQTASGPVTGKEKSSVRVFQGIPYAATTAGANRWKAPLPAAPWTAPLKADHLGPECPQAKSFGSDAEVEGNEDCLSLNIWAPEKESPVPVMVFIHGGFYVRGSSDESFALGTRPQDGLALARDQGVIVVSMNYRLGPLGFFVSSALEDGTRESHSGNFGLLDQIAALKWVAENISAFGGDPSRVTVFGQSAGASSILNLIASPIAKGLFSRAIVESGYFKALPRNTMAAMSQKLESAIGCRDGSPEAQGACLRALPASKIIQSAPGSAEAGAEALFVPNQDGWLIPEKLEVAYGSGHVAALPVILGTNADEASNLAPSLYGKPVTSDLELENKVVTAYGSAKWEKAKAVYNNPALGSPEQRLIQLGTDGIFTCPVDQMADWLDHAGIETRRYVFTHTIPIAGFRSYGAAHGFELNYAIGGLSTLFRIALPKADEELAHEMQSLWAGFAFGKDLVLRDKTPWRPYREDANWTAEFSGEPVVSRLLSDYRKDRCVVLDDTTPAQ